MQDEGFPVALPDAEFISNTETHGPCLDLYEDLLFLSVIMCRMITGPDQDTIKLIESPIGRQPFGFVSP